ncbi:PGN_0703 family putative restriction endonuclease [Bradyrhizobium oligotrophicum]|uniref:PGN_0703 family putative restriction endonuclease n=1 Tax=Bradyrhizobium TaxID=374 RepID=UPI003EBA571E
MTSSSSPSPADHLPSSTSTFKQLSRTPFVSDAVAKHYDSHCLIDSRFRRAARLLQILWMRDQGIPNAAAEERGAHLGSYLRADAADAGRNFISPQVHLLALRELLLLREEDAAVDEDRLMTNTLSSMPLVVNAFGPLAQDTKLATAVLRQLLPDFIQSVERIAFEHSPGRRDDRFLADRTAFDLAIHVTTPEGESGIVYAEVKYSEELTTVARWRERYDQALKEVRLYKDPESTVLRSPLVEQLMREHCLAQLSVDHGITPRAMFIGIGPRLNRRANAAFRVYANELLPVPDDDPTRVRFQHFTLETLIDAIDVAGDRETADQLWKRYCDFQRVYDAALAVIAPQAPRSEPPKSATATPAPNAKSKARPRKRGSRTSPTQPDDQAGVSDRAEASHD